AIVSICDSVEAAVRSLKEPTEEKIEEIVSSIINDRMMDGQLNESPLTLKELEKIHTAVCETLKGIFHSRIQYPMKEATYCISTFIAKTRVCMQRQLIYYNVFYYLQRRKKVLPLKQKCPLILFPIEKSRN